MILAWSIVILYFIPTIVAIGRRHHQVWSILILNGFFGWTGLGWVGSLIWACSKTPRELIFVKTNQSTQGIEESTLKSPENGQKGVLQSIRIEVGWLPVYAWKVVIGNRVVARCQTWEGAYLIKGWALKSENIVDSGDDNA